MSKMGLAGRSAELIKFDFICRSQDRIANEEAFVDFVKAVIRAMSGYDIPQRSGSDLDSCVAGNSLLRHSDIVILSSGPPLTPVLHLPPGYLPMSDDRQQSRGIDSRITGDGKHLEQRKKQNKMSCWENVFSTDSHYLHQAGHVQIVHDFIVSWIFF